MLRAGEGPGANVRGIGRNGGLDGGTKLAIALDEFRHPRGKPEHVLEHEDLAIAGDASANADGRDFDGSRDAAGGGRRPPPRPEPKSAPRGWRPRRIPRPPPNRPRCDLERETSRWC